MSPSRVERFVSSGGARIYRLPLQAFPELQAQVHLILADGVATLVDVGSGYGRSNDDLLAGFAAVCEDFGEKITLADVEQILITHAHIDHFGGLTFVREHCQAPVGVHELDLRVLNNYEEQLVIASADLRRFLLQAGVLAKTQSDIMSMYLVTKSLFHSVGVAFTFEAVGMAQGPFRLYHVPGHCPGQVVIQIDDVLLTADHVLSHTTPHQSPESITRNTGLGHYLESLHRARTLPGVRLALGGHEQPIPDLHARIDAIEHMHRERLQKILELLAEPKTISEVSRELFGPVRGYHVLLALEETGAHVEYLAQRGQLGIENLDAIARGEEVPILYRRIGEAGGQRRTTAPAERAKGMPERSEPPSDSTGAKPWLNFYDFWVPEAIRYPHQPVWRLLDLAARNWGDQPATLFMGAPLTWRDIKRQAEHLASALAGLEVKKGDRIGLMLPNCPQFLVAYYGLLRSGAVVVNLNPTFTEREIEHIATDAGLRMVVALDALVPRLLRVKPKTGIERIVFTGLQDYLPEAARAGYVQNQKSLGQLSDLPSDPALISFSDLIARATARAPRVDIHPLEDLAVLQYTGGTTGTPKGAMLTHFNLVANALQSYHWVREYINKGAERYLCIIPLFHAYGMTMMNVACTTGAALILLPRFDPQMALDQIRTYRPTFFPGVPTLYIALLNHPDARPEDFSSIRACNSGSAPLPLEVYERFREMTDATISEGYGLTEASPVTHSTPQLGPQKLGSIGLPFPDTQARIVSLDDGQTELPPGEIGELVIRGPQVMKGYWNQPEETAQALRGGWLYTGDIARMDADGYFYIVDRKKDMLIVSGNNVYPREVEEVLYTHPAILESGVIGLPDEYQGEAVCAFVVLKPGAQASADDIREHCRRNLAPYKVPKMVEIRETLPKSQVGKVLRRMLRPQGVAEPAPASSTPAVTVPPDISIADYFEQRLPDLFERAVKPGLPADLEGTEFTVQYTIRCQDGSEAIYGLRVKDGQALEVTKGGMPDPVLALSLGEADWRDSITGRVNLGRSAFDLLSSRTRLERAHAIRGTLHLELTKPDGSLYQTIMRYNGGDQPSVKLMMTTANYSAMQRGELSGQAAFLNGSLKFEGDLGFLMALGSLTQS